jgi:hypothetical protein
MNSPGSTVFAVLCLLVCETVFALPPKPSIANRDEPLGALDRDRADATPESNWTDLNNRVQQIVKLPYEQCDIRNILISDTYLEISLAMKQLLHVGQSQNPQGGTQMNWPTIAAWASNSVGDNIRNDTLQLLVQEVFQQYPEWMQQLMDELGPDWIDKLGLVQALFGQMDIGLCGGNVHVFNEIGTKFTLFGMAFEGTSGPNSTLLQEYLSGFNLSSQAALAEAMQHYYTAMWETDSGARAQVWSGAIVVLCPKHLPSKLNLRLPLKMRELLQRWEHLDPMLTSCACVHVCVCLCVCVRACMTMSVLAAGLSSAQVRGVCVSLQYIAWANALVALQEQTELQPYITQAFPSPFNFTWGNTTVVIDPRPACTLLISLVLAEEFVFAFQDVTSRPSDGALWPENLSNLTLPGYAKLYATLVTDAGGPGQDSLNGTAATYVTAVTGLPCCF